MPNRQMMAAVSEVSFGCLLCSLVSYNAAELLKLALFFVQPATNTSYIRSAGSQCVPHSGIHPRLNKQIKILHSCLIRND